MKDFKFTLAKILTALCLCPLLMSFIASSAFATNTWIGGVGNWNVAGNWSNGIPNDTEDAKIITEGDICTVNTNVGSMSSYKIAIARDAILEIDSGGYLGSGNELKAGDAGASGSGSDIGYLLLKGGQLDIIGTGKLEVGYKATGDGTFTISGGSLTGAGGRLYVGGANQAGAKGKVTIQGSVATISMATLYVGASDSIGTNPGDGTLEFQIDSSGVSPIQVSNAYLDPGGVNSLAKLVLSLTGTPPPEQDILLISGTATGTFDTVNGAPAPEGTLVALNYGGNAYCYRLTYTGSVVLKWTDLKWSQPPVLWGTPDIYIGWDEPSLEPWWVMALDDFRCDSNKPVTAIRWWGSLLGWGDDYIQPGILPDAFYISIWTDTPASAYEPCEPVTKWQQMPDTSMTGMDVDVTNDEGWSPHAPQIAADDFLCEMTGPITDIHIYGSWWHDYPPNGDPYNVWFTISIHADNPYGPSGYSEPCEPPLWIQDFYFGTFNVSVYADGLMEGYYFPCDYIFEPFGDSICWKYDFYIDPTFAFVQEEGNIYWVNIQAHVPYGDPGYPRFGWKTSYQQWNDAAVWACGTKYEHSMWMMLEHPQYMMPVDLAFEITTTPEGYSHPNEVIWENYCETYDVNFYGWEYDPQIGSIQLPKFEFYQELDPCDYWRQPGDSGIYWLGITALYYTHGPDYPWGWETREHFFMDDAVRFFYDTFPPVPGIQYPAEMFDPIKWDGESWDLSFELISEEEPCEPELDFGDAPDSPAAPLYPTLLASDGARHVITGGPPWLGPADDMPDSEPDGQPDPQALGDDNDGNDDEDGVTIPMLTQGIPATIIVEVSPGGGFVELWIDFNGNNNWTDAGELVYSGMLPAGLNPVPVTAPIGSVVGQTFARCRISSTGTGSTTGLALDGEVEDYEVYIEEGEEVLYKWSQPPVEIEPGTYYGWDEPSIYGWLQIAADDWPCDDQRPVSDVHWWGSYQEWTGPIPPPLPPPFLPTGFHIGIWTDVPAGAGSLPWSHPGMMIWEYYATMAEVHERFVGFDYHPQHPTDSCFKYDLQLPEELWFWQDPNDNDIYWISIAAIYEGPPDIWQWGWKTREHFFMDDAVRILLPTAPIPGDPFMEGEPIMPGWDMAFELTTQECLIGGNADVPPGSGSEHADWVTWGYPKCWCYQRQCRGDIDGKQQFGVYWVFTDDLNIFKANFAKNPVTNICSDLDHKVQFGIYRCFTNDLNIFKSYFAKPVGSVPICDQAPIITGPYNFWTSP